MKNSDIKKAIKWFENSCEPPCSEKCVQCKYEKMALDALREKEAREQGCEYCNTVKSIAMYFRLSGNKICFDCSDTLRHESAVVNFCPMCGRKLANDKEADNAYMY